MRVRAIALKQICALWKGELLAGEGWPMAFYLNRLTWQTSADQGAFIRIALHL